MNKKSMIEKLKSLEGQIIKVETSDDYIIGRFAPSSSDRWFYVKAKVIQKRLVTKVSSDMMYSRVIKQEIVGYNSPTSFAIDWFNTFRDSLKFREDLSELEVLRIKDQLTDEFYTALEDGNFFYLKEHDDIRCDFPKAKEIKFGEDHVEMYNSKFYLEGAYIND